MYCETVLGEVDAENDSHGACQPCKQKQLDTIRRITSGFHNTDTPIIESAKIIIDEVKHERRGIRNCS